MSVLRRERPSSATDDVTQDRASIQPGRENVVMDEATIDPGGRRPPQSVAKTATEDAGRYPVGDPAINDTDDTYDGEILSSSVDPVAHSGQSLGQAAPRSASRQVDGSPADAHFFDETALRTFRARWDQVQASFVDEPRHAVKQADVLVGTVMERIAAQFAEERAKLEQQWDRGDDVSTEEFRQSFQRYRAFFDRLLAF